MRTDGVWWHCCGFAFAGGNFSRDAASKATMVWFVAGLLFALFNAGTMLVNQKYKLDGSLISGMRGVGVALI